MSDADRPDPPPAFHTALPRSATSEERSARTRTRTLSATLTSPVSSSSRLPHGPRVQLMRSTANWLGRPVSARASTVQPSTANVVSEVRTAPPRTCRMSSSSRADSAPRGPAFHAGRW